jgi:phospholipase C
VPAIDPIKHVVLLMLENHSFDQMVGSLQSVYPDLDGVDIESPTARFNLNLAGSKVYQAPTIEQQLEQDPMHEHTNTMAQLATDNSGFVIDYQTNVSGSTPAGCQDIMGYYPPEFLPALHQLGANYTVCDRWFSSLPGPTWPNRFFALTGTSAGCVLMPAGIAHPRLGEFVSQDQDTLFDRLNEAGKRWKTYFYDFPISLMLNHQRRFENLANYSLIKNFFTDVNNETGFPDFAFIEPKYMGADQNDDHPPHNVFKAEKLIGDVYNAIRSNEQLWASTLLVVTYDEHGGFYDHVVPPATVAPDARRVDSTFAFDQLGLRVPAILVSPWVEARVEHTLFDHTSLLRYLTDKWQLGPLGARTAQANSIGVVLRPTKREEALPFIRVPYSDLIPPKPELEQNDASPHHRAIQAFALYLATEEATATASLVSALAGIAGGWTRCRAWVGRAILRFGTWLSADAKKQRTHLVLATTQVAARQISSAQDHLAADAGWSDTPSSLPTEK